MIAPRVQWDEQRGSWIDTMTGQPVQGSDQVYLPTDGVLEPGYGVGVPGNATLGMAGSETPAETQKARDDAAWATYNQYRSAPVGTPVPGFHWEGNQLVNDNTYGADGQQVSTWNANPDGGGSYAPVQAGLTQPNQNSFWQQFQQPSTPAASDNTPGYGSLMQSFSNNFSAPGAGAMYEDPGYQFRKSEGIQGIMRNAAAAGTARTGGALKDLAAFNSGLASQEYGNVYNRRLGEYNIARDNFNMGQNNAFNRLYSLGQLGMQGANQMAANNSSYGNNVGNWLSGWGTAAGNNTMSGADAQAAAAMGKSLNRSGLYNTIGDIYGGLSPYGSPQGQPANTSNAVNNVSSAVNTGKSLWDIGKKIGSWF